MRVLFFSLGYTTHDRHFLAKLTEFGLDVHFCWLRQSRVPLESHPLPNGVKLVEWHGASEDETHPAVLRKLVPAFADVIQRIRPDVIHAGPVQSCGYIAAMTAFHPLLVMSWGSDLLVDADRDQEYSTATRFTLGSADALVCDCQSVRKKAQNFADIREEAIVQFPWGVDLRQFARGDGTLRQSWGWPNSFVVLSTRQWEPIYGIEVLIEAFARASRVEPRLRLMLLGTGSRATRIHGLIDTYGLGDAIATPGIVAHEQLPHYFRSADLYMSCAYSDGSSISLLEAFASGLPAVVTDGPGNREWVIPGENGWFAPAGDVDAFASVLLNARASANLREIGARNRRVAETRANWNANFPQLICMYERLSGKSAGSPRMQMVLE